MLLIGSDQADTRTSVRHGGVGEAPWLRRRHAPGFHIYRYRPGKLALPGRRLRAHMMHALHAVIGAHLHHVAVAIGHLRMVGRSEEHTSELQSLMRISYAVFCLKKKNK